jgi:hypothetical protein
MTIIKPRDAGQGLPAANCMDFPSILYYNVSVVTRKGVVVKSRALMLTCALLLLLVRPCMPSHGATLVTFDNLSDSTTGTFIPSSYQGLSWSNMAYINAIITANALGTNGALYGMVSASNVAFNANGTPAEVDGRGTNFNFLSAYLTGAWNSNLNIEVQGFRDTNLVYDETKVVSATSATLFTFDYLDIDRLYFNSFGGEPAFGGPSREVFVMDNFMFEFIPEPSSLLLTALGLVSLVAFLKHRRR